MGNRQAPHDENGAETAVETTAGTIRRLKDGGWHEHVRGGYYHDSTLAPLFGDGYPHTAGTFVCVEDGPGMTYDVVAYPTTDDGVARDDRRLLRRFKSGEGRRARSEADAFQRGFMAALAPGADDAAPLDDK